MLVSCYGSLIVVSVDHTSIPETCSLGPFLKLQCLVTTLCSFSFVCLGLISGNFLSDLRSVEVYKLNTYSVSVSNWLAFNGLLSVYNQRMPFCFAEISLMDLSMKLILLQCFDWLSEQKRV